MSNQNTCAGGGMNSAYTTLDGFYIPERMMGGLRRYIERGVLPGDFLRAVLRNDLRAACERADDENLRNLPAYVSYLYNKAPSNCWGSPQKVSAWVDKMGLLDLPLVERSPC